MAGAVVLVLLIILAWLTREKRYKRLRVGFFIERERFKDEDEPES